jgi:hypothetical protein
MAAKGQATGTTVDRDALPIAVSARTGAGYVIEIELEIVRDEQVEMAIAIVIEEGAAGTPSGFGVDETRFASDIFKGTVSQIAVELVLPEVSAEEVVVAVVVIVTDADSIGPSNGFESCLLCNIGEGTVAIVLI